VIICKRKDDDVHVTQYCAPPVVYLDHWALMDIADDPDLSHRLIDGIHASHGTLAISYINLGEYAQVTDLEHAKNAESLFDKIYPNVFFINPDVFTVIENENKLIQGGAHLPPHADIELIEGFIKLNAGSIESISARDLFSSALSSELLSTMNEFADLIVRRIDDFREHYSENTQFKNTLNKPINGPAIQRGTRYLVRDVLSMVVKDQCSIFNRHDAFDFVHTIVSVSYCDYVLLDSKWATLVNQASRRLKRNGLTFPLARVFSSKNNGTIQVMESLEAHHSN